MYDLVHSKHVRVYNTVVLYVIHFELLYLLVSELCCFEGHSEICICFQI